MIKENGMCDKCNCLPIPGPLCSRRRDCDNPGFEEESQ
jgi:hypothetical protein